MRGIGIGRALLGISAGVLSCACALLWVACDGRAAGNGEGEAEAEAEAEGEPAVDASTPDQGAPDGGCECIELLSPVCGIDGVTYDNLCFADCAGVTVACTRECPCNDTCGHCKSDADCFPGQHCNADVVCLPSCTDPTSSACHGQCIAPTTCALMDCPEGYGCRCGGPGPGPHPCQCGLECDDEFDCTDPGQDVCCGDTCTDACTCHCR
jgi:hypothetical protein